MTLQALVMFALIAISGSCIGQDSVQYRACTGSAKTQNELNGCASDEAKRADSELNSVYRKLLAMVLNDKTALTKTKAAQRAWITYRDAYIEAMYPDENKQASYGTIYPMEVDLLRAKLTREQIKALKALENKRN